MGYLIIPLIIFTIFIVYYSTASKYIILSHYRVLYYVPTGRAIGIIINRNGKTEFYYYINDLKDRLKYMNVAAAERYFITLKRLAADTGVGFEDFEEYFSPNFIVSEITPYCTYQSYTVARELLKGYQSKVLKLQELTKTVVIDDKF